MISRKTSPLGEVFVFSLHLLDVHPFYIRNQLVHGLVGGGPTGAESDDGPAILQLLPEGGLVVGGKMLSLVLGEDGELLVGVGVEVEGDSPLLECVPNPQGLLHRLLRQPEVEVVREQGLELDAQKPSLGQHTALLLDEVAEVLLEGWVGNHHRNPSPAGGPTGSAQVGGKLLLRLAPAVRSILDNLF